MRNEIPCLDYPSRAAAIRGLTARGLSTQQVASQVGVDNGFVHQVLNKPEPTPAPAKRRLHRAKEDVTHIVSGVLPKSVLATREPRLANDATVSPRYRLQRADGQYLRLDAVGFVTEVAHSWIGFAHQLRTLCERQPELKKLTVITVPPVSRGEFRPTAIR